jgi:membrane carboxypeptidase/penicillin-binding protein
VASIVRDRMREAVERGTGAWVRRLVDARVPVAGKTGTTNDNTDVWFVGMTPDLVAGVWMGFDRPTPITSAAAGGSLAAPVFGRMLQRWYAAHPYRGEAWTPPLGVIPAEVDRATGQLATAATLPAQRYTEYYVEGTEPEPLKLDPAIVFTQGVLTF